MTLLIKYPILFSFLIKFQLQPSQTSLHSALHSDCSKEGERELRPEMAGLGASKILTQFRPLTCAAATATATACHPGRLVPHPPDLIKWVRREGGFVHQAVTIAPSADSCGLGLVASQDIPKGSDLIALPHHIPLRFSSLESEGVDTIDSVLVNLARQVPGTKLVFHSHFNFCFRCCIG